LRKYPGCLKVNIFLLLAVGFIREPYVGGRRLALVRRVCNRLDRWWLYNWDPI